jgi:uncharacterized phage protein (predicted DNA packaging)
MLTIEETKLHLRVDHDHEDTLITALMSAATAATADYLGLPLDQMTSTVPSPIKAATLLLIGDLFENRTAQVEKVLYRNDTYERLLSTYRVFA